MKRWLTALLLIAAAPLLMAQERRAWLPEPFVLPPFSQAPSTLIGVAGQTSRVMAIGDGRTPVGIYIYDPQGHCIVFDDEPIARVYDDRIVTWVAAASGPYELQIRNFGPRYNRLEASAR
jgi:hypothetical protein